LASNVFKVIKTLAGTRRGGVQVMRLTRTDVVLYALDELKRDMSGTVYSPNMLAETLNVSAESLTVFISRLAREGFVVRKRSKKTPFLDKLKLSDKGSQRVSAIQAELVSFVFTPERHNISTCMKFTDVANLSGTSLDRVFLLHLYLKNRRFDLGQFIGNLSTVRNDLNVLNFFRRLGRSESEPDCGSYVIDVFNMSLNGDRTGASPALTDDLSPRLVDSLLIDAETKCKQGRLAESDRIYRHIVSLHPHITRNQWFQSNLGLAQVIRRKDGPENAISFLEKLMEQTDDGLYKACITQAIGTCYGYLGDQDKALQFLSSSIRSFRYYQVPLLLAIALNNRGVEYFTMDKVDQAESDWLTAVNRSKRAGSRYAQARLLCNLADVEIKRGNLDKAEKNLDRSERLFRKANDLEGVAGVEFNRALKSIAETDLVGFQDHFMRSEDVAYPLPPEYERQLWRNVLMDRAKENGMTEAVKLLNDWKKS